MTFIRNFLLAPVLCLAAGSASAAVVTISQYVDLTTFSGQYATSLNQTFGEVNITISGKNYANVVVGNNATITATGPAVGVGINNNGLGVCAPNNPGTNCSGGGASGDQISGGTNNSTTNNEMLAFLFDRMVQITSVTWHNNDTNDLVDFFIGPNFNLYSQMNAIAPPDHTDVVNLPITSIFGIGLQDHSDQLRVAGLMISYEKTVAEVPLPAAGLLLLAGLGGTLALRRRKAA